MSTDNLGFYLKNSQEEITYHNFVLVNLEKYHYLLKNGYLDLNLNFSINYIFKSIIKPPYLFIDNTIHILFHPKDEKIYNKTLEFLAKSVLPIHYHLQNDIILTLSDSEDQPICQALLKNNDFQDLDYMIIFDQSRSIFSRLVWSYPETAIINNSPESATIVSFLHFKPDVLSYCDIIKIPTVDWQDYLNGQFSNDSNNIIACQKYFETKHTQICSLVNIISQEISDISFSSKFIKTIGVNFAITPDRKCIAMTPTNYLTISKILKNNVYQLLDHEKIAQMLDYSITSNLAND